MTKQKVLTALMVSVCVVAFFATIFVMTLTTSAEAEAAQETFHWKLAMAEPANNLFYMTIARWARELEKRSGGRVQIKQYTGGQLLDAKETLEGVKNGLVDVTSPCPAYFPGQMPLSTLTYTPFVTPPRMDLTNYIMNLLAEHPLYKKEMDSINSVFAFYDSVNHYNIMSRKPLKTVEDFKGLKIRVVGEQANLYKKFGALPVACAVTEAYTGLERGLFDAIAGCGEWWFHSWRIFEAFKGGEGYYIEGIDTCPAGTVTLINKNSYNALPPDIKKIIEGLKWEMPSIIHEYLASEEVKEFFKGKFKAAGMKMMTFPAEERAKIAAEAEKSWDEWKERKQNKAAGSHEFFDAFMKTRAEVEKIYPDGIYEEGPVPKEVRDVLEALD
jgi:TRAP-type C4-dicarboxylate transport system substrate-binding protein